jgi:hypothetical protein
MKCNLSHLHFLIYEENFVFFFISVILTYEMCGLPEFILHIGDCLG